MLCKLIGCVRVVPSVFDGLRWYLCGPLQFGWCHHLLSAVSLLRVAVARVVPQWHRHHFGGCYATQPKSSCPVHPRLSVLWWGSRGNPPCCVIVFYYFVWLQGNPLAAFIKFYEAFILRFDIDECKQHLRDFESSLQKVRYCPCWPYWSSDIMFLMSTHTSTCGHVMPPSSPPPPTTHTHLFMLGTWPMDMSCAQHNC